MDETDKTLSNVKAGLPLDGMDYIKKVTIVRANTEPIYLVRHKFVGPPPEGYGSLKTDATITATKEEK